MSDQQQVVKRLVENLQADLHLLSNEAKKKHFAVKEAAEACIVKIRNLGSKPDSGSITAIANSSSEVLHPLLMGCDSKNPRLVQISLSAMQKLISYQALDVNGACVVVNELWNLIEIGVEDLKVLQTITLLLTTTSTLVVGPLLAKCLVMCFRLYFSKRDAAVTNTSHATVRQLVTLVYDRSIAEGPTSSLDQTELVAGMQNPPASLAQCTADAFMLFQDLCRLVNGDSPVWLAGMTEMSRILGLELIESILSNHSVLFQQAEFAFLLKELLCPLVIKMFSPSVKFLHVNQVPGVLHSVPLVEKPSFPLSTRLLRLISILVTKMSSLLVTECEIFLTLILKFLSFDRLLWQQALALEVLHKVTVVPDLIRYFCESYDMRPHATKVLQDIVNALSGFMQGSFLRQPLSEVQNAAKPVGEGELGAALQAQPAFLYRGTSIILNSLSPHGVAKCVFLEMLEKNEPPPVLDGYCFSVAYASLLDLAASVQEVIANTPNAALSPVCKQLLSSTQVGTLASLSLLLEASMDEGITSTLLKCLQTQISLAARVGEKSARDACLTALCKAALPPNYMITVFGVATKGGVSPGPKDAVKTISNQEEHSSLFQSGLQMDLGVSGALSPTQVVAVGTPCPTPSLPSGSLNTPIVVTSKNLQCMRTLLAVACADGPFLDTAWQLVLTTLQHLVWFLGLKPSAGGGMRPSGGGVDGAVAGQQVITTAVMADLPVLSGMLSKLCESTAQLDDVGLHHVLNALCQLSSEAMEVANTFSREPSYFAVAKLLEFGVANLNRLQTYWKPLTTHLLEVSCHSQPKLREWGSAGLSTLVKSAFAHEFIPPVQDTVKLQLILLAPLSELNSCLAEDTRQRQVECVLHLLENRSKQLVSEAWPVLIEILGTVVSGNEKFGEGLVRSAFQAAQLIVTEFLPALSAPCFLQTVEVVARFGAQRADLNTSLAAVGLLMNISDYLFHHPEQFKSVSAIETSAEKSWLCLYTCLSDLCVDPRAAVRKSSSQTLFSTISVHGGILSPATWTLMVWQVLFPLLDRVKALAQSASNAKVDASMAGGGSILIHHTRDTESKQWAETRCLTLDGVVKVFSVKRGILSSLRDFTKAWTLLLEFIENAGRSAAGEVALAALKSFKELLSANFQATKERAKGSPVPADVQLANNGSGLSAEHWQLAWKVWLHIASACRSVSPPTQKSTEPETSEAFTPTPAYLLALLDVLPIVFDQSRRQLAVADIVQLAAALCQVAALPPATDNSAGGGVYLVPSTPSEGTVGSPGQGGEVSSVQAKILEAVGIVYKECVGPAGSSSQLRPALPALFELLLCFVSAGCIGPQPMIAVANSLLRRQPLAGAASNTTGCADWVTASYVPFSESALKLLCEVYQCAHQLPEVVNAPVLLGIVRTLRIPLAMKYRCPAQATWKLAHSSLISLLKLGLPIARQNSKAFEGLWPEIAQTFEDFLFNNADVPPTLSFEETKRHEFLDCQIIDLIRTEILPHAAASPPEFVSRIVQILNRGSISSGRNSPSDSRGSSLFEPPHALREDFARSCFETLLRFSYGQPDVVSSSTAGGAAGRQVLVGTLAVEALLQRCGNVAKAFVGDHRTVVPMPRHRTLEMISILKALTTLIGSLRSSQKVEPSLLSQVVGLYSVIVNCIGCKDNIILEPLMDALRAYGALLRTN